MQSLVQTNEQLRSRLGEQEVELPVCFSIGFYSFSDGLDFPACQEGAQGESEAVKRRASLVCALCYRRCARRHLNAWGPPGRRQKARGPLFPARVSSPLSCHDFGATRASSNLVCRSLPVCSVAFSDSMCFGVVALSTWCASIRLAKNMNKPRSSSCSLDLDDIACVGKAYARSRF